MPYFGIPIRNGLPIGLGSVAGFGIAPFSPESLFENGEVGAWYDPSDVSINWRRNLLTYTEEFDNATAWGNANTTVTANAAVAPDGTTTADLIYPATTGAFRDKTQQVSSGASAIYTSSVYMKASGFRWGYLRNLAASAAAAWFDLQNGVVGTVASGYTASIQNVGNGWYRCSITNTSALSTPWCAPGLSDADNSSTATASGTSGIYLWGAQLELGSTATAYQQIITPEITYLQTIQPQPVLFTDSAGTTPVTGVEQFVGLMLDKSKGLVLGPELVINGDFSSGTGWTGAGDSFSISGGVATLARTTTFTYYQGLSFNVTAGNSYWVTGAWLRSSGTGQATVQIRDTAGGVVRFQQDASPGASFQPFQFLWTPTATESVYVRVGVVNAAATVQFDLVSVRELPGNHAFQTSSAKRPKLAARYNLLTYSEEFDNPYWLKGSPANSTVSADQTTAPNGTLTADLVAELATTSGHNLGSGLISFTAGTTYTASCYVKNAPGGRGFFQIGFFQITAASANAYVNFDVVNGSVTDSSNATGSITDAGNGWFRCVVTVTSGRTYSERYNLVLITNGTAGSFESYLGDITKGLYIWGADLRPASQATGAIGPTYQRVAAATVYDTAGFLPYLAFDGLDDSMSTNSIDFSAGDKMTVWAGVRKLSDAVLGCVLNFRSGNIGSFGHFAPEFSAPRDGMTWETRGSGSNVVVDLAPYSAPVSYVFVGASDLGAPLAQARINASAYVSSTSALGGLFGSGALTIGELSSNYYLNGNIYSLIVRGAQSTQSQIEATEAWVNSRTGAY